jgi:hypothetical protein
VLITNLMDEQMHPPSDFNRLYHLRWGIDIYQPYCLLKSVFKKLLFFISDFISPKVLSRPLFA